MRNQVVNNPLLYGGMPVQLTQATANDNNVNDNHDQDDSEHLCLPFDRCADDEPDLSSPQWFEDVGDEVTEDVSVFSKNSLSEDDSSLVDEDVVNLDDSNTQTATALLPGAWANVLGGNQTMMAEIYYEGMMRGASLSLMDDLVQLFRTRAKQGFDIGALPRRDTFMNNLRGGMGNAAPPKPIQVQVPGGPVIPKFPLLGQIMDLIHSSDFHHSENLVLNIDQSTRFGRYEAPEGDVNLEVNSGKWYEDTYSALVTDRANEWLFPLIFYIDKTGTDAMQRFPLEPLMVTTSVLKQKFREKASCWRHVGFVPPFDLAEGTKQSHHAEENLQVFHRCLSVLLADLVTLQKEPPTVKFILDGVEVKKRLILPVAFVMGDQLSQDKQCGRRAVNAGGAGRIHRRCMCSCLHAACTDSLCQPVRKVDIENIVSLALECKSLFLEPEQKRRAKFAKEVLEKCYSMYAIENAWSTICFGTNEGGIYSATLDDPMHYCDSGSFKYLAEVAFLSMQKVESGKMENFIQGRFRGNRSSVREDLPKGKYTTGFTRTTLLTAAEKVGLIFSLFITLGMEGADSIFSDVLVRMQRKYELDSTDTTNKLPNRGDVYFFTDLKTTASRPIQRKMDRTLTGVKMAVRRMSLHNLTSLFMNTKPDELQTEYLLITVHTYLCWDGEEKVNGHHLSNTEVEFAVHLYQNLRQQEQSVTDERRGKASRNPGPRPSTNNREIRNIKKHGLVRKRETGVGGTAAILTTLAELRTLMLKMLAFHSFIHYFEEVPAIDRLNKKKIQMSLNDLISDFKRCVYRGDDSVDCDTCKLHSHLHLAEDIENFGHPMNWEAGKGERGLKIWAKMAAHTAQKINVTSFTHQSALRIADASLLRKAIGLASTAPVVLVPLHQEAKTRVRSKAHFVWDIQNKVMRSVSKRGKEEMVHTDILHAQVVKYLAQMESNIERGRVEIWKDALLSIDGVPKRVRACSTYDRFGEFYDWVNVEWPADNSLYPARILLIYLDSQGELSAILHGSEWTNSDEIRKNTKITERRTLECSKGMPVLRKIRLADIKDVVYVVEHSARCPSSFGLEGVSQNRQPRKHKFDVVKPRYEWASEFLVDSQWDDIT